jgi:hypothetical protein
MGKKILFAGTDSGGAKVCINFLLLKSADFQCVVGYLYNSVFFLWSVYVALFNGEW